jgi:hypothetical protein
MDLKIIKSNVARLAKLVGEWSDEIDVLERDVALQMLRDIYAEMRLGEIVPTAVAESVVESAPEPELLPEPTPEPESKTEPEPMPQTEPEPEPEPEHLPQPEPEKPIIARRVVDPEVIRTLYGSEPITSKIAQTEVPKNEPEPVKPQTPTPEPINSELQMPTLGDVMSEGRQTLGEVLATTRTDMASVIAAAEASSLRSTIGLNDKFLMIRDIFEGNETAYEEAIARLDEFGDLDEAIIYIHDNYDWSADSDGVKLLIELLERKLS